MKLASQNERKESMRQCDIKRAKGKKFFKTDQGNQAMDPRITRSKKTHQPLSLKDKHLLSNLIVTAKEGKMPS